MSLKISEIWIGLDVGRQQLYSVGTYVFCVGSACPSIPQLNK